MIIWRKAYRLASSSPRMPIVHVLVCASCTSYRAQKYTCNTTKWMCRCSTQHLFHFFPFFYFGAFSSCQCRCHRRSMAHGKNFPRCSRASDYVLHMSGRVCCSLCCCWSEGMFQICHIRRRRRIVWSERPACEEAPTVKKKVASVRRDCARRAERERETMVSAEEQPRRHTFSLQRKERDAPAVVAEIFFFLPLLFLLSI